jgi:prepilin-type N-terminal cleavage/methylation domain-containing protein
VRGRRGMTLIELLVGLVITSLMLAGGYAALATMMDHRENVTRSLDEVTHAASVRRTLTGWLSGAMLRADGFGAEFRGLDGLDDGFDDDELAFRSGNTLGPEWEESAVRLYVDRDPSTPERGLVAEVGPAQGTARERVELVAGASGLQVSYLSALSREPVWLPSWISTTVMPRAIQLQVAGPPDSIPPLLRLPVLITLGDTR